VRTTQIAVFTELWQAFLMAAGNSKAKPGFVCLPFLSLDYEALAAI